MSCWSLELSFFRQHGLETIEYEYEDGWSQCNISAEVAVQMADFIDQHADKLEPQHVPEKWRENFAKNIHWLKMYAPVYRYSEGLAGNC
jgi:hypothetical protein